jgi:hypothetical protein
MQAAYALASMPIMSSALARKKRRRRPEKGKKDDPL